MVLEQFLHLGTSVLYCILGHIVQVIELVLSVVLLSIALRE